MINAYFWSLVTFTHKAGTGYLRLPENMSKFGKGILNNNGENLLDHAKESSLVLSNTLSVSMASSRKPDI